MLPLRKYLSPSDNQGDLPKVEFTAKTNTAANPNIKSSITDSTPANTPSIPNPKSTTEAGKIHAGLTNDPLQNELSLCLNELSDLVTTFRRINLQGNSAYGTESRLIKERVIDDPDFINSASDPNSTRTQVRKKLQEAVQTLRSSSSSLMNSSVSPYILLLKELQENNLLQDLDDIDLNHKGSLALLTFAAKTFIREHKSKSSSLRDEKIPDQQFFDLYRSTQEKFTSKFQRQLFNMITSLSTKAVKCDSLEEIFDFSLKLTQEIDAMLDTHELPFRDAIQKYFIDKGNSAELQTTLKNGFNSYTLGFIPANKNNIAQTSSKIIDSFSPYLGDEVKANLKESSINKLPQDYNSCIFGEHTNYQQIARRVLDQDTDYYKFSKKIKSEDFIKFNEETESRLIETLWNFSHTDGRRELAKAIFDAANNSTKDSPAFNLAKENLHTHQYDDFIGYLRKRVGALTNLPLLRELYEMNFDNILEYIPKDANPANLLNTLETDLTNGFYSNNPSPEFLKNIIAFYHEKAYIDGSEKNSIDRILNQMPKNNFARDQRRDLHKFLHLLVASRLHGLTNIADLFSSLLTRMQTNTVSQELDSLLEVQSIENHPRLAPINISENLKSTINELLDDYHSNTEEKVKKAKKNLIKAKLNEVNRKHNESTLYEFLKLAKVLSSQIILSEPSYSEKLLKALPTDKKLQLDNHSYSSLYDLFIELITENFSRNAIKLKPKQIQKIQEHVKKYPKLWMDNNFYLNLLQYHALQKDKGGLGSAQIQTERLLHLLAKHNPESEDIKTWSKVKKLGAKVFEPKILKEFNQRHTETYDINSLKPDLEKSYTTIRLNTMKHLGIKVISDLEDEEFKKEFLISYKEDDYQKLLALVKGIDQALEGNLPISMSEINEWQVTAKSLTLHAKFEHWNEFINNINQIKLVNQNLDVEIKDAEFSIDNDPHEIIRAGEKPFYTCQRIIDVTGHNGEGKPITRALYNHFTLAQAKVNGEVDSRSILELAPCHVVNSHETKTALLVEWLYSKALVPSEDFYESIIDWALYNTSIDYAVIPSYHCKHYPRCEVSVSPIDTKGYLVYRDTKWGTHNAIDLNAIREIYKSTNEIEN